MPSSAATRRRTRTGPAGRQSARRSTFIRPGSSETSNSWFPPSTDAFAGSADKKDGYGAVSPYVLTWRVASVVWARSRAGVAGRPAVQVAGRVAAARRARAVPPRPSRGDLRDRDAD